MRAFSITCERQVTESQTLDFEAETLADALRMAATAYTEGTHGKLYDFEACQIDVTELDFHVDDENGNQIVCNVSLGEAEEATTESLRDDYGVVAA